MLEYLEYFSRDSLIHKERSTSARAYLPHTDRNSDLYQMFHSAVVLKPFLKGLTVRCVLVVSDDHVISLWCERD